jgi:uncharacterized repeat protein (TIGR03803 family)
MLQFRRLWTVTVALVVCGMTTVLSVPIVSAQSKYKTLYTFPGSHKGGYEPEGRVIFDQAGNLYGTTAAGGKVIKHCYEGCGTVFKLTPQSNGGWAKAVLYKFTGGEDGARPSGNLIFDTAGNLYGTASSGGDVQQCGGYGCGVVFKLSPKADGTWTESVLHTFSDGQDGANPASGVIFDQNGSLYGTTEGGNNLSQCGGYGCGSVIKLTPQADGTWSESTVYNFTGGADGGTPAAGLIFDQVGNLYGTTQGGGNFGQNCGSSGCGVVFEVSPQGNGNWTESVLYSFAGRESGDIPSGGVIFDRAGNLYGTTYYGGTSTGTAGLVFELNPTRDSTWTENVLYDFKGAADGANPPDGVVFDKAGNLYGTAQVGGNFKQCVYGCGVVFRLSPNSKGGWTYTMVHSFYDHPGAQPVSSLIFDAVGNLYGTDAGYNYSTFGSVFEITP